MCGKISLIVCSLLIIGIGYVTHVKYPEECDYSISMKLIFSSMRFVTLMCGFVEKLGGNYCACLRVCEIDFSLTSEKVEITEETFGGVKTMLIKPKGFAKTSSQNPAIIYYHGGGWAVGSYELYAGYMKKLAEESKMIIVFPLYRLAPEHKYPIPFEDCLRATLEFVKVANDFSVDPNKIVLAGDSAGGNLATAVALNIRKQSEDFKPCMMNLVYPAIQMSNFMLPSYQQNPNPPLLTPEQMVKFFLFYMGIQNGTDLIPPMANNLHMNGFENKEILHRTSSDWVPKRFKGKHIERKTFEATKHQLKLVSKYKKKLQSFASDSTFAPLSATDEELKTLPRTHILTSEYDVLRDDGVILYERMKSLGLKVSQQNLQFGAHGLLNMYGFPYSKLDNAVEYMLFKMREGLKEC